MSIPARLHFMCVCLAVIGFGAAYAQEQTAQHVVVSGEEEGEHDQFTEMGEYTQPAWAQRSRMSSTTSVYVLSPQEIFAGNLWEAIFPSHGKTVRTLCLSAQTDTVQFSQVKAFSRARGNSRYLPGT